MPSIGPISGSLLPVNLWVGPTHPLDLSVAAPPGAGHATAAAFQVNQSVVVGTAHWYCGTSNGNIELGILDSAGSTVNRLATTGSIASPGTGARSQALTAPLLLVAGLKYYAYVMADGTFTLYCGNGVITGIGPVVGLQYDITQAIPMPSSIALGNTGYPRIPGIWFT